MKNRRNDWFQILTYIGLQLIVIAAAFLAGYYAHRMIILPGGDFPQLTQAYQLMKEHAYDPLPSDGLMENGMIRGMLQVYNDPYTVLIDPPQAELQNDQLSGKFGGIGVRIEKDTLGDYRLFPFPDSPAASSGILEGDLLTGINELLITRETPIDNIEAEIRGPVGSVVEISYLRLSETESQTVKVTRKEIGLPSVTYHLVPERPDVGIVQLNVVADTSPKEITDAMRDLMGRGAQFFILDLRNNPGGLVDAGVRVARLFLTNGDVLQEQYKGQDIQTFSVEAVGEFANAPLVVLVNNNTASAAEIVAGAIQGQQRAELIGSVTYGKDSVQLVFDLKDRTSLHITSARWWIPGLELPRKGQGLQPDILLTPEQASGNEAVLAALEQFK